MTIAALLPKEWNLRLVDLNVRKLKDADLRWADLAMITAMNIQKASVHEVLERCRDFGVRTVCGGPYFTMEENLPDTIDHLVLNEAEETLPRFLKDLSRGEASTRYETTEWADLATTPIPRWDLIRMGNYATMSIQYSRGCPFDCEFCDITRLCGRRPRTKSTGQILAELERLYRLGWRRGVFFVDDNFIGNKKKLRSDLLPALADWMKSHSHPFTFNTQASIELADDAALMKAMVQAGFDTVFVGIETPNDQSLTECGKVQNRNRDLVTSVKMIQAAGLQVQGGFIVGFDHDPPGIFDSQIKFIQNSGIVTAMVGLLNVLPKTRLYQRLKGEKRLLDESSGDNTDLTINFIPRMDRAQLIEGYRRILKTIYSPRNYYERVKTFLKNYKPSPRGTFRIDPSDIAAFLRSIISLGVLGKERFQYWKLMVWTLFRRPTLISEAVTLSIYGHHFRKIYEAYVSSATETYPQIV